VAGDVTVSGGGTNIQINAGSVGNAELALMPSTTVKGNGNVFGGPAAPTDLSIVTLPSLMQSFTTPNVKGVVTGPATASGNFLRDDGSWQPANEVFVGATDPGASFELWVDTSV
jgi:hypothetical protein